LGLAEWTRNKKPVSYPWVKTSSDRYDFDVTKADKIFELLLQQWQIQLSPNHMIPSAEELKRKRYCHWHNSISHSTNDCKIFHQQNQSAIEKGRIKFEEVEKLMKIDGHPFPVGTNKVEISLMKGKAKVLTSARAKESTQKSGYCVRHMTGLEDLLSFSAGPINFGDRGRASQFGLQLTREKIIGRLS